MAIYLGHTTAQRILESRLALALDPTPLRGPVNCVVNKRDVRDVLKATFGEDVDVLSNAPLFLREGERLNLLVSHRDERRNWKGSCFHVVPMNLPTGSFLQLSEDILVACPELCLLQQASHMSLLQTIKLAMSFCGIYRLNGLSESDGLRTIFDRKPLMTPESARHFIRSASDLDGVKLARRALRYALPLSGSPMETVMVLPLYLPRELGGLGLPRPIMNGKVKLEGEARLIKGGHSCRGDAMWLNRRTRRWTILEYQSYEDHESRGAMASDYARALALETMGHRVHFVSKAQVSDINQVVGLARLIVREAELGLDPTSIQPDEALERLLYSALSD